jgi:hypothetical protein
MYTLVLGRTLHSTQPLLSSAPDHSQQLRKHTSTASMDGQRGSSSSSFQTLLRLPLAHCSPLVCLDGSV